MSKKWRTTQFEKLSKEWNEKLKESGFEDCEKEIGGTRVLKQAADYPFRRKEHTQNYREAKLEYFTLVSQNLHGTIFDHESDRLIMERTADGKTIQEISKELKVLGWKKFNRDTIRYIRRRYETRWGIRSWKREDCVSRKVATPSSPTPQLAFLFATNPSCWQNGKDR